MAACLIGAATSAVLILTARTQIFDTNFYGLWEATALLQGDHLYRDVFEWGIPLQSLLSASAQVLSGQRLLGEFVLQWTAIVLGSVVSFRLGERLSGSWKAAACAASMATLLLAVTGTHLYPKLLLYPLAIAAGWRFIETPTRRQATMLGLLTATAFLFRHDHGVYVGITAVVAFVCARRLHRERPPGGAHLWRYGAAAAFVLAPWLALVQANEGLAGYVDRRAYLYDLWSASRSPLTALTRLSAFDLVVSGPRGAIDGRIQVQWEPGTTDDVRVALEAKHRLRQTSGPDAENRREYLVENVNAPGLLELEQYFSESRGLDWDRLEALSSRWPSRPNALAWIEQVSTLVPLLTLAGGLAALWRTRRGNGSMSPRAYFAVTASVLLLIVGWRTFREPSYALAVAPLTAALAAPAFVLARERARAWRLAQAGAVTLVFAVTGFASLGLVRSAGLFNVRGVLQTVPSTMRALTVVPAIEGTIPREQAVAYTQADLAAVVGEPSAVLHWYLHDCIPAGERLLLTGSTPFSTPYYTQRSVAGGQLFWQHGWRADPAGEQEALALIRRQQVPFAFSTTNPVLDDFELYPAIRAYLVEHYAEIPGTRGYLFVDRDRPIVSRFGALGFPCFR